MATIQELLEAEHVEIDAGIEAYANGLKDGTADATALATSMQALRRHIYLEEEYLFGLIKERAGITMPIFVMLKEHGEIWRLIDELDQKLADGDATVADTCTALLELLDEHNQKEEPIVYPYADTQLDGAEEAQLRRFIDEGVLPEGWVCQYA